MDALEVLFLVLVLRSVGVRVATQPELFDELIAFLRAQRIASFKLPERLELRSEFPLSPAGKILKRTLREEITAQLAAEKAARK